MTVTTEVSYNGPYDPNGVTTSFAFTFKAHVSTDIRVVLVNANGVMSEVSSALYTVTINAGMGGSVDFLAAPSSTSELYVLLDPDFKQEIEFVDGSRWRAPPVAKGYDRAAMRDLLLKRDLDRAILVPFGENGIELTQDQLDLLLGAVRTPLMVTPLDYSGTGDNTADDTQAMIDALASGLSVWLPQGYTFKVTSDLVMSTDQQRLIGPGVINFVGDCGIVVQGANGVEVDITVDAPDHTGTCIKVINSNRIIIHRLLVIDGNNCLYVEEANTVTVHWLWGICTGYGIKWFGDDTTRSDILDIGTAIIDPGDAYGLDWDGNCHTLNCRFLGIVGGKGAIIRNTAGVSTYPAIGRFQNIQVDYPTEHGINIAAGLDYDFVACYVLGSTTGSGLYVAAAINDRNVRVSGGKFRGNTRYGIENAGGVLLTGGNLDLQDNVIGETLGNVWSEFQRVSLDAEFYSEVNATGDALNAFDTDDYEVFDRSENVWRRYIDGNEVMSVSALGVGKLRDWVTPADFGPVGTADDTAVFAAALQSGKAVYVPPLAPTAGNKPQTPYRVSQIVIPNGAVLVGQYGATYIKQTDGANVDFVVLASQNVSNFSIDGLILDGNSSVNTSGCGVNIIGPVSTVAAYNPQASTDPYFYIGNLLIFNCAGDGLRFAGAAADGTAMFGGGAVIENIRTFNSKGRGAYFDIFDAYIRNIDCGVTGTQGVVFDEECGSLMVNGVKAWYTGQITATSGEGLIIGGGQCTFKQIFAQANIPGHGIKLVGFYESELEFVVQGAGSVSGFGSTPTYLYVGTGSTAFKARGICTQTAGAPAGSINLLDFSVDTHSSYTIDITHSGTYTSLLPAGVAFPIGGGGVIQSIVLNGKEQMGRAMVPVYPAAQNPTSGFAEYVDANDGIWKGRSSSGVIFPISPSVRSSTSTATLTPTFVDDQIALTAQAEALTIANPTGTAFDGCGISIRIKDNGTARAISYGTQYRAIGVTLPTTTVISKTLYLGMIYNAADTKWDVVAVAQEA